MTILASSGNCERLFRKLGDLLEHKRRSTSSEVLITLRLVRPWVRAGFKTPYTNDEMDVTNEEVMRDFNVCEWDTPIL